MKTMLNILHLEDDPFDAALVHANLREGGLTCTIERIETQASFASILQRGGIDLILADLSLPAFDGMSALKMAQAERPEIPFIFVSGTLGEDQAISSLKSGAVDYVLKKNLSRLAVAVTAAIEQSEIRKMRTQMQSRTLLRKGLIIPPQRITSQLPRI